MSLEGNEGLPALYLGPIGGGSGESAGDAGSGADSGVAESSGVADGDSQDAIAADETAESMPEVTDKPITPEQFRKFQAQADKRAAALAKQHQEAQAATMAAMAYIAQLEAQNDKLALAGAPQEVLDAKALQRELAIEKFRLDQEKMGMVPAVRAAALMEISNEYGIPVEDLAEAQSRAEALTIAKAYKRYSRRGKLEERAAKGTDKQEGSSPSAGVDISKIKDSKTLFAMAFRGK